MNVDIPVDLRWFSMIYECRLWGLLLILALALVVQGYLLVKAGKIYFLSAVLFPLLFFGVNIACTWCGWHYRMELRDRYAVDNTPQSVYSENGKNINIDRMPPNIRQEYAKHDYQPRFRDLKAQTLGAIVGTPILFALQILVWVLFSSARTCVLMGKRRTRRVPDPLEILYHFYPEDTPLRQKLLSHSLHVREKAMAILADSGMKLDVELVAAGAMLHDIGIAACHAPEIGCEGEKSYIAHGVIGAGMLREYGAVHGVDLEACARICERHTGSGLTARDVRSQALPIPEGDYLPETPEEKLICLADKFFSKSGDGKEKSLERIRRSLERFGADSVARFDDMCRIFKVK